jgi:hypothetical protein
MATTIVTKYGSDAPAASDLVRGELAVDTENGRLYTENAAGAVVEIGLNPEGNVGIGTDSPAQPLEILKTSAAAVVPMIQLRNGSSSAGSGTAIKFIHSTASNATSGTCELESIRYSGNLGALTFKTSNNGGTVTERMRVNDTGVGVGTDSPTRALSVFGDTAGVISITSNSTDGISSLSFGDTADDNAGRVNYLNVSDNMLFYTATAERMRIDASGNLLVGRTSRLTSQVKSISSDTVVSAHGSLTSHQTNAAIMQYTSDEMILRSYGATAGTGEMVFKTGGGGGSTDSEAMRIDSSGNLLVGKTSDAINVAGVVNYNAGIVRASRNGNSGQFGRISTDGDILTFYKDTVTVGSIGVASSRLYIGTDDTGLRFTNDEITPFNPNASADRNGTVDLGGSSTRFKDLYLSGGAYLGGTAAANKLDYYEEGTWTPTYTTSNSNATVAYTTQRGRYTKVGNLVFITWYIGFGTITSAGTGNVQIAGVPFQSESSNDSRGTDAFYGVNWDSANYNHPVSYLPSAAASAVQYLMTRDNGTWTTGTPGTIAVSAGNVVSGSMTFRV